MRLEDFVSQLFLNADIINRRFVSMIHISYSMTHIVISISYDPFHRDNDKFYCISTRCRDDYSLFDSNAAMACLNELTKCVYNSIPWYE